MSESGQLGLDFQKTIEQRFRSFHREHPEVYGELVRRARMMTARGFHHYGISALYELVRWHFQMERGPDELFKCNNNYKPYYARLILKQEPDLAGFFETRVLRAS